MGADDKIRDLDNAASQAPAAAARPVARREASSVPEAQDGWSLLGQEAIMRIPVAVRIVLGAARMPVAKLMSMTRGSVIPLDRKVGDMVDIVVNDRVVARGEIVILDEAADRFAVAVQELVRPENE